MTTCSSRAERLNREIRKAHKALIEPTPDNTLPATRALISSQQQSQSSPIASRGKMRRIKTTVEKSKQKKLLKTYGSQGRDLFEFHGASDGEMDNTLRNELELPNLKRRKQVKHEEIGNVVETWASSSGDTEVIEPRTSFTDNDISAGSSMPPPALKAMLFEQTSRSEPSLVLADSSTSPRPTIDTCPLQPSKFDDRMPTPTLSSRRRADETNPLDFASATSSQKRPRAEMEETNLEQFGTTEANSSASILSPSKTTPDNSGFHPPDPSMEDNPAQTVKFAVKKPVVVLPQPPRNDEGQDELSLPTLKPDVSSKSQVKESKRHYKDNGQVDELGSDDIAIGLPKEHYQPRPSKFRSGRGNGEVIVPADYSRRPETTAKKKRKLSRRKTTAFHELIPKEEDEDDDDENEVISRPSFRSPNLRAAEPTKGQDELKYVREDGAEIVREDGELEDKPTARPTKPTVQAKQRGRPRRRANEASENKSACHDMSDSEPGEDEQNREDSHAETEQESGPESKAGRKAATKALGAKKQRGRPKKGAAETFPSKPTDEKLDESNQGRSTPTKAKPDVTVKGPRKRGECLKAISNELVRDSDEEPLAADESEELPRNILHETGDNIILPKSPDGADKSPSPTNPTSAPPETPHKAAAPQKGPDKHSPISSGKVAYRVGLSKRARIEPLLRIVRKC